MSLMQGKPCSHSPDAWDIPRAGNFPGLRMLMEAQTLAKAWREVKEKLLSNPIQSNGYDHWTQKELGSSFGSDAASVSSLGQVTSFSLHCLCPKASLAPPFPHHVFAKHSAMVPRPPLLPVGTDGPRSCWWVLMPYPVQSLMDCMGNVMLFSSSSCTAGSRHSPRTPHTDVPVGHSIPITLLRSPAVHSGHTAQARA